MMEKRRPVLSGERVEKLERNVPGGEAKVRGPV